MISISTDAASIGAGFGERLTGLEDGLADALVLTPTINVSVGGRYHVAGTLVDESGAVVATAGTEADLTVGADSLDLSFDGPSIYRSGRPGPYQLVNVVLARADGSSAIEDEAASLGSTAAYSLNQFQHFVVEFDRASFADQGLDTDSDGTLDLLRFTGNVRLDVAGTYAVNARLVAPDGTQVTEAETVATLSAGEGSFALDFDGQAIGGSGNDGPYTVADLSMYSTSDVPVAGYLVTAHVTDAYTACEFGCAGAIVTERVSESSTHGQANGASDDAFISADGRYVAFRSKASNLLAADTNGVEDAYMKDRLTGEISLASSTADGTVGNSLSQDPAISADGRYVTFRSQASNFVTGDTNGTAWDIFTKDLETGAISRDSVSSSGGQANKASDDPAISADGRYVVFRSAATNLVAGDTNATGDIFLRDRVAGTTTRISVADDGSQANGDSAEPAISDDGRYVAFESEASNLVSGDTNGVADIFLRDTSTGTTTRVSVATDGTQADGLSNDVAISADGTTVAFEADATNLVAGDTNGVRDVFRRVLATGVTTRVSVADDGSQGDHASTDATLSADGTKVGFASDARNLISGDTNNRNDVFIRDTTAGTTTRYSIATDGTQSDGTSENPWLTADGDTVAFQSLATNLVAGDTNATNDIFVRGPGLDATSYTYDHLSRLTGSAGPDGSPAYAYDPVGNRTSKVLAGTTTSYDYDRADRITAAGSTSITVDANGNTTAKGADSFAYDQANRLTSATVGGTSETYAYDGDGLRVSRTVGTDLAIRFVSDVNRSLPGTIADGTRTYVWGLGLAYAVSGSAVEVYHADRLGSVRSITDASGAVAATYRYDDWGNVTDQTGSSGQPFGFTGEPADATGLTYLRARYYDPVLGRMLSRDEYPGVPVRPTSCNRYSYVEDNPATMRDPSGRKPSGSGCIPAMVAAAVGLAGIGIGDIAIGIGNVVVAPSLLGELALAPADAAAIYATGYLTSILGQATNRPCEDIRLEHPENPFGG